MASKELKEERRAQGLCVYCGRPAVIKADGTPARRCEKCSGDDDYLYKAMAVIRAAIEKEEDE